MTLDLAAISEKWLNECGACDYGVGYPCTHPSEDYRPVMLNLVREVERLQAKADEQGATLRRIHQAIRKNTTAAAVALAMCRIGDPGVPSILDELDEARTEVEQLRAELERAKRAAEKVASVSLWSPNVGPLLDELREALDLRQPWSIPPTPCCDLHGRHCEPPSELCCWRCTESVHPDHGDGSYCSASDLSGTGGGDDGH